MLTIPRYIEVLDWPELPPEFHASRVELDQLFDADVPLVRGGANIATERAKLGFAAATTEWIAWRLNNVTDVSGLFQFTEALWAATVDYRYFREREQQQPDNNDSVANVLFSAWQNANALYRLCKEEDGHAADCVRLVLLVRLVLPKKSQSAFKSWLEFVLRQRVVQFWRASESGGPHGSPVPREAFDPEVDFDPFDAPEMLRLFLESLDHENNPYMCSPEEMKRLGFEGTPYTF